jgi:plastocyanin
VDVRFPLAIGIPAFVTLSALSAAGCIGGRYGDGSMSMATPSSTGTSIVTIVGQKGMLSFEPNPAPFAQGTLIVWRNTDVATHRIVMNDGSFDSGNIAPGGWSPVMRVGSSGSYHCTIHPTMMFGSITWAAGEPSMPPPLY